MPKVRASLVPFVLCLLAACRATPAREYELRGQVLRVQPAERVVTIRHDDIKGFMPAMTMPFKVSDGALLDGLKRGDLVRATLVVSDTDAYLSRLVRVGHTDLTEVEASPSPAPDLLRAGDEIPNVRLVQSDGRPLQFSSLRGSAVVLTFVYTRCPLPQFCPLMDRQFAALARRLRDEPGLASQRDARAGSRAGAPSVRLLSISFDPEYDTPAVLAAHAREVGADGITWRYVTADRQTIDAFAPRFGLVLERDEPGTITHNLRTAVVDRQGRLVKIYDGNDWTVGQILADLLALVR